MPMMSEIALAPRNYKTRTNCCVYGPPKSGKGQAIAQLATKFNLVWFDLENGWEILLKLPPELQAKIQLIKLPDTKGWPIAIDTCCRVVLGGPCNICHEHGKVDCGVCKKEAPTAFDFVELNKLGPDSIVVFDTGSQLGDSAIAHAVKGKPDDYKLEFADWATVGNLLNKFMSYIQVARFHSIVTAHELEVPMENDAIKMVPRIGTKNYAAGVAGKFSHVVHLEMKNGKHVGQSASTTSMRYLTGSRTDVAIESMGAEYNLLQIFMPYLEEK